MAATPFYVVEFCKGDPDKMECWFETQRYVYLWVARAYTKTLLKNRPDLKGQVRIVLVTPLSDKLLEG